MDDVAISGRHDTRLSVSVYQEEVSYHSDSSYVLDAKLQNFSEIIPKQAIKCSRMRYIDSEKCL